MDLTPLAPDARLLALAVGLDLLLGDPVYPLHPVRLLGASLSGFEALLRRLGGHGYGGGIALFLLLAILWGGGLSALTLLAGPALHLFILYSFLALGDLLRHGRAVDRAPDAPAARAAVALLVGRDVAPLDHAACRRAAIESLAENLPDGFLSPVFWYLLAGLPGLILYKIASTMDSMVGYRTPRYLQFGWCGARLDDLLNWLPARLTWLLLAAVAALLPGLSGRGALRIGWAQHAVLPGPNPGWSEAAMAGALSRRLIGPIWKEGRLVTEIWLGDPAAPPAGDPGDFARAARLILAAGLAGALGAIAALALR